ncbi:MAG: hypothetical protein B7Z73_10070, partial [Planctomycetia bacterium 21-64-5]
MIDSLTHESLHVIGDQASPGLVIASATQLDAIRQILDAHEIPHWVDEEYISFDGEPDVAFINLSRDVDPSACKICWTLSLSASEQARVARRRYSKPSRLGS